MGTRLPIYPYFVGRGRHDTRRDPESKTNAGIRSKFEVLAAYLARDDVRRCARNVIPVPGQTDTLMGVWVQPAVFEDPDDNDHTALQALIERVGKCGTIAIPSITHIVGREEDAPPNTKTRELMKRIYAERVEVFPLQGPLNRRRVNLYKKYVQPGIPSEASALFDLIPELASWTIRYLHDYDVGMGPVKKILDFSRSDERANR